MRLAHKNTWILLILFLTFGIGLAFDGDSDHDGAFCRLSKNSEMDSLNDSLRGEPTVIATSPPVEKKLEKDSLAILLFNHPELYYVPCGDYHEILKTNLNYLRILQADFMKNRSWFYGFDEARKRGYRLGEERVQEREWDLHDYLDRPAIPHPKYVYGRPHHLFQTYGD